jgi:hypothetical protein
MVAVHKKIIRIAKEKQRLESIPDWWIVFGEIMYDHRKTGTVMMTSGYNLPVQKDKDYWWWGISR